MPPPAFAAAAGLFEGRHDFKAFGNTGSGVKTTERVIYSAEVKSAGDEVVLYLTGNGFLYNMVRVIAGVLVRIACGKMPVDEIEKMFRDGIRSKGVKTMPPNGLTLEKVFYSELSLSGAAPEGADEGERFSE